MICQCQEIIENKQTKNKTTKYVLQLFHTRLNPQIELLVASRLCHNCLGVSWVDVNISVTYIAVNEMVNCSVLSVI